MAMTRIQTFSGIYRCSEIKENIKRQGTIVVTIRNSAFSFNVLFFSTASIYSRNSLNFRDCHEKRGESPRKAVLRGSCNNNF